MDDIYKNTSLAIDMTDEEMKIFCDALNYSYCINFDSNVEGEDIDDYFIYHTLS